MNPTFVLYNPAVSRGVHFDSSTVAGGAPSQPQGISYLSGVNGMITTDLDKGLALWNVHRPTNSISLLPSGAAAVAATSTSGLEYDPASDTVWYSTTPPGGGNGTIAVTNSDLTAGSTVLTSVNTPRALALAKSSIVKVPPIWSGTQLVTLDEGATETITAAELSVTDADTNAADLQYTVTSNPGHGHLALRSNPALAITSFSQQSVLDGDLVYVHDGSENFEDHFTVKISDGTYTLRGAEISLKINAINENDPVLSDAALRVDEGATTNQLNGVLPAVTNFQLLTTDADSGDTFTYSLVTQANAGTAVINSDGTFSYTHAGTEARTDSFELKVTDANLNSSVAKITVTIDPVNDNTPVGIDDLAKVDEGGKVTVLASGSSSVLANDTDVDMPDDTLSAQLVSAASHGTVSVKSDGTFSYQHDGSENFTDTFDYLVKDANGKQSTATVNITVAPINDNVPLLPVDTISLLEGGSASKFDSGRSLLLAGATDLDAGDIITLKNVVQPLHGTLVYDASGKFSYQHSGDESLTDEFRYSVEDAAGHLVKKTVKIIIEPINDAPAGQDKNLAVVEDIVKTLQLSDFGFADIDGHAFKSVYIEDIPGIGKLELAGVAVQPGDSLDVASISRGDLIYTPAEHRHGVALDTLLFRVVDDGGISNAGQDTDATPRKLIFDVSSRNDDPYVAARVSDLNVNVDEPLLETLDDNAFGDHDGDNLVYTLLQTDGTALPTWLSFDAVTLELSGVPGGVDRGSLDLTLSADDRQGGAVAVQHFQLNVLDVNNTPTGLQQSSFSVDENSSGLSLGILTVLDSDSPDSHIVTVDDQRFEIRGNELWLKPGNSLNYELEPDLTLQIAVVDSGDNRAVFPVEILVRDTNDAPVVTNRPNDVTGSAPFTVNLPDDYFTDEDNDALNLKVTLSNGLALPSWLVLDAESRELRVLETAPGIASLDLLITSSDGRGGTVSDELSLNLEPQLGAAVADEVAASEDLRQELLEQSGAEAQLPAQTADSASSSKPQTQPQADPEPLSGNISNEAELREAQSSLEALAASAQFAETTDYENAFRPVKTGQWASGFQHEGDLQPLSLDRDTGLILAEATSFQTLDLPLRQLFNPLDVRMPESYVSLSQDLDETREEMENQKIEVARAVQTSVTVSTGVSVGYIVWLLRSSALIGSVLSSLPAWRSIDPLPVLSSLGQVDDNQDDDSLESLVDEESASSAENSVNEVAKRGNRWWRYR